MSNYAEFMMAQHEAMADFEERMAYIKNRAAERSLAEYDESCRQYKRDADDTYTDAIASGMTHDEAVVHVLRCGYGPRLYNPPMHALVKYIVHR